MPIQRISATPTYTTRPADLKLRERVLYIHQFNDEYAVMPEAVSGLKSVDDVLAYFKPEITVLLTDREDIPHAETFRFTTLYDFTPEGLIQQSLYLRVLQAYTGTEPALMLPHNMKMVLDETRPLEIVYRGVELFFANAGVTNGDTPEVEFLSLYSDQLDSADVINRNTINHVTDLLQAGFNRYISLDAKYTLLLMPGGFANRKTMETWVKLADNHKMLLVTDWPAFDSIGETLSEFKREKYMTNESQYGHTLMTINQIVARSPYVAYGEADPLYLSLSPALAGAILRNPLHTPAIGPVNGLLMGVEKLRFIPDSDELKELKNAGLLTAIMEADNAVLQSGVTLYHGDEEWLTAYSTVRAFGWLEQGVRYLLDLRTFENWTTRTEKELTLEIMQFLNTIQGPRRFLLQYDPPRFIADPAQLDRLILSINVRPHQSPASYNISLQARSDRNPEKGYNISFWGETGRDPETGLRAAWRC